MGGNEILRARAAYDDKTGDIGTSSELCDIEELEVGVVDRDDGYDVVITAKQFLSREEELQKLRKDNEALRKRVEELEARNSNE